MHERILVPLDGSETAEAILPHLHRFLLRHPGEVILLQVSPRHAPDFHFAVPGQHEEVTAYLRKRSFELIQSGLTARGLVKEGSAPEEILKTSQAEGVTMIALSTHGRTGLSRMVFGSVAEAVLRDSPVPVLLTRASSSSGISRGRLEKQPFRHLLVPVDGSVSSGQVLPLLLRVARPIDTQVTLLHVAPSDPYSPHWPSPAQAIRAAEAALTDACIPTTVKDRQGEAASEIARYSQENDVDLILMATHGRSGPARWVLGSVTEAVLRSVAVPMIVIRQGVSLPPQNPAALEASASPPPI
jgi:nucleotide-binding universal stress UspA family protein